MPIYKKRITRRSKSTAKAAFELNVIVGNYENSIIHLINNIPRREFDTFHSDGSSK